MAWVRGAYLWTDCGYAAGYRAQVYAWRNSYRLVSPSGRILLRGSEVDVRNALANVTAQSLEQTPPRTVIVVLHGLAMGAWAMSAIHRFLRRRWPEAEVVSYQYASTAATVQVQARDLIGFLEFTHSANVVHFVAHSLGNILLRHAYYLAEQDYWSLPSLGRHVMLGPPNQGATNARKLNWFAPLRLINGPVFRQLGVDWEKLQCELAVPPCPFGIIAGDLGLLSRLSFLLSGRNDFIVSVDETKLAGAADFLTIHRSHSQLLFSRPVLHACQEFLETGSFTNSRAFLS